MATVELLCDQHGLHTCYFSGFQTPYIIFNENTL